MLLASAVAYLAGIATLRRRGHRWPLRPTIFYFVFGLGSYAWISFGFLGAYSTELRWAFTTRIALLLFAVPALVSLGMPIALARVALTGLPLRITNAVVNSRVVRLFGNAIFAPVFAVAVFLVFLTPFAAVLRESPGWEWTITVIAPLAGLLMVLPIAAHAVIRTGLFITIEFLLAFVELLLDAIPGLLLRLNDTVLDHAPAILGPLPLWFPNALHDQHLSGDFLWFIAEMADVPVLIFLFIRWMRHDKREGKKLDELTDEQMEALTRAHLNAPR
ncbi:cytochrome c oxidase assembly protein [Leifsonia poae]|uniref:cytochrome c oxidase assembly protein n=1 Tax=Leifsonia poae TaxID=110933 RepID=UPI001CBE630F|nr:cytochrome c oxidase assembly protein [Leifsonia poae]